MEDRKRDLVTRFKQSGYEVDAAIANRLSQLGHRDKNRNQNKVGEAIAGIL